MDYAGWTRGIAFAPSQDNALADPDGDGLQNAFEYLLGFNPLSPGSGAFPGTELRNGAQLGIGGDPNKTYLTLQVRVRQRDAGTTLIAEAAASIPGLRLTRRAKPRPASGCCIPDGEFEILTYYYHVPIEDSPTGNGVMRLRAIMQ